MSSSISCLPKWSKSGSADTSYECSASAAWPCCSCWLPAPGGDFLDVRSNKNKVSALQTQVIFINKVEIPKYDKVVALAKQVQALQAEFKPLVASEVDWLVVLNQFGQYLPSDAVLSDIQMTVSSQPKLTTISPSPKCSPDGRQQSSQSFVNNIFYIVDDRCHLHLGPPVSRSAEPDITTRIRQLDE